MMVLIPAFVELIGAVAVIENSRNFGKCSAYSAC
jgi:hypothetical protein